MKKIIIVMFALAVTFSATAQSAKRQDRAEFKKEHFGEKHKRADFGQNLNLTADQKTRVQSLNENFKAQLKDLKSEGKLTDDQQKERRKSLMQEHRSSLEAILTPEQKSQLEDQRKNGRGKVKGEQGERFNQMNKQLNLTDQQGLRIKEINQDFRTKQQELSKNESLSKGERKSQIEALQKRHTAEIKSILTQEQKDKLAELKKNNNGRKASK